MTIHLKTLVVVFLVITTSCTTASETADPGDALGRPSADFSQATIVLNAAVYTVDETSGWADAFAYDDAGVIIAVGTEDEVVAAAGENAIVLDAGGNMVLPGFQDIHVHVPEAGINLEVCFFPEGLSLDEYEQLAVDCALEQADADWVRAAGASLFDLRDTDESPLDVLDRAVPDRPAIVLDNLGHAAWTNSAGLEAADIAADDPDPQGGVLHRDDDGQLTGLLLENAQQIVRDAAAPDDDTVYRGLLAALDELARSGVTTISDAGGYWGQNHPAAWDRAEAANALTVRAFNSLYVYPDRDIAEQLAEFEARFRDEPGSMLRFDTAKVYVDGILDLGTASLIDPYQVPVDANYPNGFNYFTAEQLVTYVDELHHLGYRINFHAIGDQAVRDALDAVEAIEDTASSIAARRHRSTHTYLVDEDDIDRFEELGMIADFQQSQDAVATDYHEFLSGHIGDRAFDLIPTGALLRTDATVTLSSDWDAGPLPPLGTIQRSLTREENAVPDLETAIAMHTIDAAYALGHDDMTGTIEVGKYADFVVLDQNIFDVDVTAIGETRPLLTVVAGSTVYSAAELPTPVEADDEQFSANPSTVRDDVACDLESLPYDDETEFTSVYFVVNGNLGAVCYGEADPTLVAAWEQLVEISPPLQLHDLALFAGFNFDSSSEFETAAFVNVADDEGMTFQMSINLAAHSADPDEALLTIAHEFSHVFTNTTTQLDRSVTSASACGTYFNGEGCYFDDAVMAEWVRLFWNDGLLDEIDADAEPDPQDGEERCALDGRFLGSYAASNPEEDFAETFSAFVLGVNPVSAEIQAKLDWIASQPGLAEFRDRAERAGLGPLVNNFEPCGT